MCGIFCFGVYVVVLAIYPFPYDQVSDIEYSKTIFDKDGNLLRAFLGKDDCWLLPVKLSEINPNFINATIAIEDKRFKSHHGVDPSAMLRAVKQNLTNEGVISGASTISMQVMRLVVPKDRDLWNKLIETVHAIRLETLY